MNTSEIKKEVIKELNFKNIRRTECIEILSNGEWINVETLNFDSLLNKKIDVKIEERNGELKFDEKEKYKSFIKESILEYYTDKMYEKILDELLKLEIKYIGKGEFNIYWEHNLYQMKFLENEDIIWTSFQGFGITKEEMALNINNIFLEEINENLFKKKLSIHVTPFSVKSIITKVLIVKYRESNEYKLKNIYK
jgi:hypothetical protein